MKKKRTLRQKVWDYFTFFFLFAWAIVMILIALILCLFGHKGDGYDYT